jgi:hypothetical protein
MKGRERERDADFLLFLGEAADVEGEPCFEAPGDEGATSVFSREMVVRSAGPIHGGIRIDVVYHPVDR